MLATTGLDHVDGVSAATRTRHRRKSGRSSALISIIGGMSVLGRAGIVVISRKVGSVPLYKISILVMAASYLPFTGYGWQVAFAATLGFGYGLRIALTPVVLIEPFGLENFGSSARRILHRI